MLNFNSLLADRRAPPYFNQDRTYYSTSRRSSQWTAHELPHYIPTPASFVSPWNTSNLNCQPEYNSRSVYPEPPQHHRSPPSLLDAIDVPRTRNVSPNTISTPHTDTRGTSSASSSASPPPPYPVKEEQPDEDGFIMDLPTALPQYLAPPTEVPLRATQACPRMRRMMSVFRLNPFAMHEHGGRGVLEPWAGGEARALEEEPRIFEFQLQLTDDLLAEEEVQDMKIEPRFDATGLRAFSPDFEPVEKEEEPESSWELYPALSSFDPVVACPRTLHYQYNPVPPPSQSVPRRWPHSAVYM